MRIATNGLPIHASSASHREGGAPSLASALLRPIALRAWLIYFAFAVYSLFWISIFLGLVRPWINGDIETRIGADSDRYWGAARILFDPQHDLSTTFLTFRANYLGPVLEAAILHRQSFVVVFNFLVLLVALKVASTIRGVATSTFLALLMINVETGVALVTLNKEIFALMSAVLMAKFLLSEKRSVFLLGLTVLVAAMTRWEEAAVVLAVWWFTRKRSYFASRYKLAILFVIAAITIGYPIAARVLSNYLGAFTQYLQGANTVALLERVQENFGFPIVLLPKIILDILGQLTKPTYYLGPFWENGFVDIHSMILLPLFSLALVVVLVAARSKGLLAMNRPIALLVVVYVIITAVTPFVQPRYEYFAYVLLCLELARAEPVPVTASL
jgi:hypothetical protein